MAVGLHAELWEGDRKSGAAGVRSVADTGTGALPFLTWTWNARDLQERGWGPSLSRYKNPSSNSSVSPAPHLSQVDITARWQRQLDFSLESTVGPVLLG